MDSISFKDWISQQPLSEIWASIPSSDTNSTGNIAPKCRSKWSTKDEDGQEPTLKQQGRKTPEQRFGIKRK